MCVNYNSLYVLTMLRCGMDGVNVEIMRFCKGFMRAVGDMPIRGGQFAVLDIMCNQPGPHMPVMLADSLGVSKAMISAHLSALMAQGYVVRVPSPEDGRSVYVMPTKRGKDLCAKINKKNTDMINEIKSQIGIKKFNELVGLIRQVNQIIDK